MRKFLYVFFIFILSAGYCSPASPPLFQELPATSVVTRINGVDITKAYILRGAKAHMMLAMNKSRTTRIGRREGKMFVRDCQQTIPKLLNAAAVKAYAEENAVSVPSNVLAMCSRDFSRRYGVYSKKLKRWHTVDDLKYMLGANAWYLDQAILDHARYIAVTNAIISNGPIVITDTMVSNRIESIVRGNEIVAQTNALIYAHATNIWSQIVSKKIPFDVAATNYSEDVYIKNGSEWGTFSLDQIADDLKLLVMLPTLDIGGITPPIESDNGLAIIRVDERSDDRKTYTFSRIFFRLPMLYDVETPDEARETLRKEAELSLIRTKLEAQRAKLKVDYPCGAELFAEGSAPLAIKKGDLNP